MLRFEHVKKIYKKEVVIDDISFSVEKGSFVVLIGPSGCGKTTSLKMINRLIEPSSGKIYLNDEDIQKADPIKLRRNIGYVVQQIGLFPHMTIEENIEIIPFLEKKESAKIKQKTIELMEMIGMKPDDFLYRYPVQLSGGQQQRIGVARAFANEPELILMDEPFSALDPISKSQMQEEIVQLQAQLKKTIVFVTHDMDEAIKIADKICILNKGKVVQYDTPEMIMKNPANSFVSDFVGRNRIWSTPEFIKAKDIMITDPVVTNGETTILRCINKMSSNKVDSLLIIDKENYLKGTLTLSKALTAVNKNIPVKDIMKVDFHRLDLEKSVVGILDEFKKDNVSNIPVTDKNGQLFGLITKTSLLSTLSEQYREEESL